MNLLRNGWLAFGLLLAPLLSSCQPSSPPPTIRIFAAASLLDSLGEIATNYEKEHAVKLMIHFGSSGELRQQIATGAPADLFISADEGQVDQLQAGGFILEGSRKDLLINSLVVIATTDSKLVFSSIADILQPTIKRIALANTEITPAGIYAKSYLTRKQLWDHVSRRAIYLQNVRGTLATIEAGNADVGIVYKTDALITNRVKILYQIPPEDCPKISYPVTIIASSTHIEDCRKFMNYLHSPKAQEIFKRYGFEPAP